MKKISIAWMLLASCFGAYAQSCCCTGAGANYSILPNMTKNVISLRYSRATYFSITQSLNPDLNGMRTDEMLNTLELFGRFNLNNRFQLSVFVPVDFIRQHSKEADNRTNSLGDMSFMAQYAILNPLKCNGKKS